jgi:predicted transcriptional regulator
MKTTVYSWRVSPERKAALESLARKQKRSVAELLDDAVGRLLQEQAEREDDDEMQRRLRLAAMRAIGRIAGGEPSRAERARATLREKLQQQRLRRA